MDDGTVDPRFTILWERLAEAADEIEARTAEVASLRAKLVETTAHLPHWHGCSRCFESTTRAEAAEASVQHLAKELMDAIGEPMYAGSRDDWKHRALAAEATLTAAQEALKQLERYNFECEAGPLRNCVHWQRLEAALGPYPANTIAPGETKETP